MADRMSVERRSALMSSIKGKDTRPERLLRSLLHREGMRFQKHRRDLPGTPDIVFTRARVAVFVDGDFWHGFRFPAWRQRLSPGWARKIETNRQRDRRNFQRLRRMGWSVVRIWEHQIYRDPVLTAQRVRQLVETSLRELDRQRH